MNYLWIKHYLPADLALNLIFIFCLSKMTASFKSFTIAFSLISSTV